MKYIKSNNNLKSIKIDAKNDSYKQSLKQGTRISNRLLKPLDWVLKCLPKPSCKNLQHFPKRRSAPHQKNSSSPQQKRIPPQQDQDGRRQSNGRVCHGSTTHLGAQRHKHTAQRNIQPPLRGKTLPLKRKDRLHRNGDRNFSVFSMFP